MNNNLGDLMQELFYVEYGRGRKPTVRQQFRKRRVIKS